MLVLLFTAHGSLTVVVFYGLLVFWECLYNGMVVVYM